jgi:hypothetical protein
MGRCSGMQTTPLSATPRLCHPSGVRALLGPVSGGGSACHAPATGWVPSGNRAVAVWVPVGNEEGSRGVAAGFPEGTKRVAGRWRSRATPGPPEKSDAPRTGVPEGWNANNAFVSNPAPLSPLRGEGPFGARVRWWRLCATHRLQAGFPPGTGRRRFGFLKGTQRGTGRWRFGFPSGTKRVAGEWLLGSRREQRE